MWLSAEAAYYMSVLFFLLHAWGDMIDGVIHGLPLQESLQRGENAMGG